MAIARQLQIVLAFAFITRLLLLYCFPLHMTDYMLINSAAQNLIDGHGMGFTRTEPNDLSTFYFEGLRLWPPLVTALTAFFLSLTGNNVLSDLLMMTVVLIAFIWILFLLCKEIGLTTRYLIYIFLFFALNPELIKRPGFSDLAAALFSLAAILFFIKQLKNNHQSGTLNLIFGSLLFFLPSAFRYQYYPVTILFPILLFLASLYLKDSLLRKQAVISLLFVFAFIIAQEFFLFVYTAQPIDQAVAMDRVGFFLFNLQNSYPFFFKTFINISYIENTWKHIIYPFRYYYFATAAFLVLAFLFVITRFLFHTIQRQKQIKNQAEVRQTLSVLSLIPLLLMPVAVLISLSLTHNSRSGLPGGWTYVNEGRYYILPSILLLILTFWFVQKKWPVFPAIIKKTLATFFAVALLYNLALTLKFGYNALTDNIPDKEQSNRFDRAAVYDYLQDLSKDTTPTVLTYSEPYFAFFPFLNNIALTKKIELLSGVKLATKKKIRLIVICQKDASQTELAFIKQYNAFPVLYRSNCIIYSTTIEPE